MMVEHDRWDEFLDRLNGPEGVNAQVDDEGDLPFWDCDHTLQRSRSILRGMGFSEDEAQDSLVYFEEHGGYCGREILLNAEADVEANNEI